MQAEELLKTQRFNIALLPANKEFIAENIRLAQENFADQADQYLLGENAWPHITLCQFDSEQEKVSDIWTAVKHLLVEPISINLGPFYISLDEDIYWVGLATLRTHELFSLQLAVNEVLNGFGIKSRTPHSTYFPHITWARCPAVKIPQLKTLPQFNWWQASYEFYLSLGATSEYGVYLERLFPLSL